MGCLIAITDFLPVLALRLCRAAVSFLKEHFAFDLLHTLCNCACKCIVFPANNFTVLQSLAHFTYIILCICNFLISEGTNAGVVLYQQAMWKQNHNFDQSETD